MKRELLRAAGLALVVAALWCHAFGRTSLAAWRVPIEYHGDAWPVLAQLKAGADGDNVPLRPVTIHGLGAPGGAGWNGYLLQHKLQYWLAGQAVGVLGLFVTANLLLLAAAVLAALSFYAVCRYFRVRVAWAFAGAAAFGLSPFLFYRSLNHLTLSFYWPVPLAILVATWVFGRRALRVRSRRFAAAAAIVCVVGHHNIYYAGLLGQFLALGALAQALRTRLLRAAVPALLLIALLVASVLVDASNVVTSASALASQSIARPYGNLERYALKPIELLLPITHPGLAPWAGLGTRYFQAALYRGEMGAAYLGLAGVAALLWLTASAAGSYVWRPRGYPPAAFLAVCWALVVSVVGGLNGILGTLGFVWFRATSRYSIWILALVLLWGARRLSRTAFGRKGGGWPLAALLGALALADQLPPRRSADEVARIAARVASDATLVRSLEATLPDGAMLFQLPVVPFPEGPRIHQATDYEHLRPYLHARTLRFSYGLEKGDAAAEWQERAAELEPAAMVEALERIGFAGLLVNRKGYEDAGAELKAALAATGRMESVQSADGDFLFVRLRPAPDRERPEDVLRAVPPTGQAPSAQEPAEP